MTTILQDPRLWTALLVFSLAGWLAAPQLFPKGPPAVAAEDVAEITYVCTETGEVFGRKATAAVLTHPLTGQETLVPAVYDPKTRRWRPGPPPEVMHRRGLLRPAS